MQIAWNDTYGGELLARRVEREAGEVEWFADPGKVRTSPDEPTTEQRRLNDLACDSSTTARRWGYVAFNFIRIEKELSAMLRKDNSLALPLHEEQRSVVRKARDAISGLGYGAVAEQKKHESVAESYRVKGKVRS
jgi:hypothetical protein